MGGNASRRPYLSPPGGHENAIATHPSYYNSTMFAHHVAHVKQKVEKVGQHLQTTVGERGERDGESSDKNKKTVTTRRVTNPTSSNSGAQSLGRAAGGRVKTETKSKKSLGVSHATSYGTSSASSKLSMGPLSGSLMSCTDNNDETAWAWYTSASRLNM
jgi:hypothetical protein